MTGSDVGAVSGGAGDATGGRGQLWHGRFEVAPAEALVELRRAFTLQKDAEIAAHIAEVLWVSGNKEEARKYFEESRKLDPENRSLLRALEKTGL